jgi:hypothetical protein
MSERPIQYLSPEEEPKRSAYAQEVPDPAKYVPFLKLVQEYDFKKTRNGLFDSPIWKKRGAWGTFEKMECYARARRAVGYRVVNGERLLGKGEAFDKEIERYREWLAYRGPSF